MIYSVKALDSLFFRSSAPFEAQGETSLMESLYPPLPGTYAGALKPFLNINPDTNKKKRLRISYNGIMLDDEICFPQPLDMVAKAGSSLYNLEPMNLEEKPISNFPLELCLTLKDGSVEKVEQVNDIYVKKSNIVDYLKGEDKKEDKKVEGVKLSDSLSKEVKLGIAIDPVSKTAKEKHICQIQTVRPQDNLKLAFETNDITIDSPAFVKLGGEGRTAVIESTNTSLQIEPGHSESNCFKLYFATPAIFNHGWLPRWIDPATKKGCFHHLKKSIKVKLMAAAVGRYVPVGGFGYERKEKVRSYHPKEMRYAIPAGSVYYFKIIEGSYQDAIYLFHQRCISDYREGLGDGFERMKPIYTRLDYCDRGFGYTLVSALSKEQEDKIK